MNRINSIIAVGYLLLANNAANGQTTTPYYDNIKAEKAMAPLQKIKQALIDNSPVRQPQFNQNYTLLYTKISLFKPVTVFAPSWTPHKVKLDYMPKPNMGLLYNKFQY